MSMNTASTAGRVDNVVARIERLPTSWWHVKTRIIVGVATFFDAFDALAIATVLPVLVPMWKLAPQQIGLLISAGFLGQLIGALLFGWIAASHQVGAATAAFLAGVTRTATGSYLDAFVIAGLVAIGAAVMALTMGASRTESGVSAAQGQAKADIGAGNRIP